MKPLVVNIVSDLATPHNNHLVAELRKRARLKVVTWYALQRLSTLPWKEPLGGREDNYYFDSFSVFLRLLMHAATCRHERFLLIGYSNTATKLILLLHWFTGRSLYYWSDHPELASSWWRRLSRAAAYFLVKRTAKSVFVVGERARAYFHRAGFQNALVVNLPICIEPPAMSDSAAIREIRMKYRLEPQHVFAVAASRLTPNKGYDTLLRAVSLLAPEVRERVRVLIVGDGPEGASLKHLAESLGVSGQVEFVAWMEVKEYERVVAAADFFVHPARFDAWGGGTLYAMGAGVPVIGSMGAGSALERIVSGQNGFLFPIGDAGELASCIERIATDAGFRKKLGQGARITAEEWTPARSSGILEKVIIGDEPGG